jgi:hypothetical protein
MRVDMPMWLAIALCLITAAIVLRLIERKR